ncbi:hypothetical protein Efla_000642 [Eimeria flavescens]
MPCCCSSSARPDKTKLCACLLAAAAAAVAAAEGDSPRTTLHVGLEECLTAANISPAARLSTRLGFIERSTELENAASQTLNSTFLDGDYGCEKLKEANLDGVCMEAPLSSSSLHALVHDVYARIGTAFVSTAASLQAAAAAAAAENCLFLLCVHAGHQAHGAFWVIVFEGKDAKCLEGM